MFSQLMRRQVAPATLPVSVLCSHVMSVMPFNVSPVRLDRSDSNRFVRIVRAKRVSVELFFHCCSFGRVYCNLFADVVCVMPMLSERLCFVHVVCTIVTTLRPFLCSELQNVIHVCDDFIFIERTFVRHRLLQVRADERERESERVLNERFLQYVRFFILS